MGTRATNSERIANPIVAYSKIMLTWQTGLYAEILQMGRGGWSKLGVFKKEGGAAERNGMLKISFSNFKGAKLTQGEDAPNYLNTTLLKVLVEELSRTTLSR